MLYFTNPSKILFYNNRWQLWPQDSISQDTHVWDCKSKELFRLQNQLNFWSLKKNNSAPVENMNHNFFPHLSVQLVNISFFYAFKVSFNTFYTINWKKKWNLNFVLLTKVLLINGDLFLLKLPCNQTLFIKLRYVDIYGSRLWPSSNRIPCHGQLKTILLHFMKTNYKSIVITQAWRQGLKL